MLNNILLSTDPGAMQMYMIVLMVIVFYFFMILPQVRRNKAQKKFRDEMSKGDNIITTGGIHGKITELKDTTLVIELEDGGKMRIEKTAVSAELTQTLNKTK